MKHGLDPPQSIASFSSKRRLIGPSSSLACSSSQGTDPLNVLFTSYIYGVENATDLSVRGVLFGILSSVFGSLYTIYLKVYQEKYAESTTEMLLFLHLDTSAILPLGMLVSPPPLLHL